MKYYKPSERLVELGLVLQYDSFLKDNGKNGLLNEFDRMKINQQRGYLISETEFEKVEDLEIKINEILLQLFQQKWKPEIPIQYGKQPRKDE